MPIHDQSYRHFVGVRAPLGTAWSVIMLAGLRALARRRLFVLVLLASWGYFGVLAVSFYFASRVPIDLPPTMGRELVPSAEAFRRFFDVQGFFAFVVTVYVGAGLIAADRRAHALQIYLSKPLSRFEYVGGKFAILLLLVLLVTWVPAMLLLGLQVVFAGDLSFVIEHAFLVPAITLYGLLYALTTSAAMLALSSLSTSPRFVGIVYAGLVMFTEAMRGVLEAATGRPIWTWVSLSASLDHVGDVVFRVPTGSDGPWPVSLLALVVVVGASLVVLDRRVRGVEVVT